MTSVLADTRAIVSYLNDRSKLSPAALQALSTAERTGRLFVSAITLVEVWLEVEAGTLPSAVWDGLREAVADPKRPVTALPVDPMVASTLRRTPPQNRVSLPARIIAATAAAHELRVVSGNADVIDGAPDVDTPRGPTEGVRRPT
jgi:PIN domain nuclease of toxin-antitoxin system